MNLDLDAFAWLSYVRVNCILLSNVEDEPYVPLYGHIWAPLELMAFPRGSLGAAQISQDALGSS